MFRLGGGVWRWVDRGGWRGFLKVGRVRISVYLVFELSTDLSLAPHFIFPS
jgi:hypothetical protein